MRDRSNIRSAGTLKTLGAGLLALSTLGCVRGCTSPRSPIHPNPNMDYQEKYETEEGSGFFYDGSAMRVPPAGTVPRDRMTVIDGRLTVATDPYRENDAVHTGMDTAGEFLAAIPLPESDLLLARGAERYTIYCQPCHNKKGNGKGILTEKAGVPVPSFHEERLRALAPGEIFDIITNGKGLMQSYRYPVSPPDRWAIIAYVRQMQRDQQATEMASAAPQRRAN